MPNDVQEICLKFVAYQHATVEQARDLEVKITAKFVEIINAHEKIRPFLREYPFPPRRAEVTISFYDKNNCYYVDGGVDLTYQVNNRIYYRAKNPDNLYLFISLGDEPYEEALKIIQNSPIVIHPKPEKPPGFFKSLLNLIKK